MGGMHYYYPSISWNSKFCVTCDYIQWIVHKVVDVSQRKCVDILDPDDLTKLQCFNMLHTSITPVLSSLLQAQFPLFPLQQNVLNPSSIGR